MPQIHFQPDNKIVEPKPGQSVLKAAIQAGIPHTHICGGNGRCSTCRVMVLEGLEACTPRSKKEQAMANRFKFSPNIRLACQLKSSQDLKLRRLVIDEEDTALTSILNGDKAPISTGEEKKVAILFADIRGFTAFSESLPPYDVMHVLNRYFYRMVRIIERNSGYVDNYMGDGLLALFGMEASDNPAFQAVTAGIGMLKALDDFNTYIQTMYRRNLHMGIGVHYGDVIIGVIGACNRKRKTAIGDEVNLASRIEEANKELKTSMLISEPLYEQVKSRVKVRRHGPVRIKGKSGKYVLLEVCGILEPQDPTAR